MASPYASGTATGGGNYGGSPYAKATVAGNTAAPAKKRGGILGTIEHVLTQTPKDLESVALHTPGGLVDFVNRGAVQPWKDVLTTGHVSKKTNQRIDELVKETADSTAATLAHPLRHPGDTLLLGLPAAGGVARATVGVVAATRAARAGEGAASVVRAAVRPPVGARTLDVGGMQVRGHYSRAAGSRAAQKAGDTLLQKGAERSVRVENLLHRRAAKWEQRNQRVGDAVARAPGTMLEAAGRHLQPEELRALRLVAEEVPVRRRLAAQELRMAGAKGGEVARHQQRIDVTQKALGFLDEGPGGKPVFKADAHKLRTVFEHLRATAGDREQMLKSLDLLDEQAAQAAKTKTGRVAAGEPAEPPAHLPPEHPGQQPLFEAPQPNLFEASPSAVHVGNPAERSRLTGKPRVSSTGTFGHTRKPSSLRAATGAAVEHAVERNDVTRLVAERHAEAVRLTRIDRAVQRFKQAGEPVPRRKDDVWVWTDKLISNERIPHEVRQYLQNPDSLARLAPDAQHQVGERIKQAVFEQRDWRNQQTVREFEQLAKKGKGVFVPRRLLGDYAKRDFMLGDVPGMRFVDAVNNAQKAALVYLKLNYPVVQGLSNAAMNIVQQGFAYPLNITRAIKVFQDPEVRALSSDLMGQGAVTQATLEGKGAVAHVSERLAQVMSRGVDAPARLLALYHEARVAGYGSPPRFRALLTDPAHAHDLAEVVQRAKEQVVIYDELGPFERAFVRRLIFVYPWQKGATRYAAHFLRDHPVQAAASEVAGSEGQRRSDETFGPVPSYLEGAIPVAGRLVNPSGFNPFQTPAQIGATAAGLATGNPATPAAAQLLAPLPAAAVALASRRDDIGRPLTGNLEQNLLQEFGKPIPVVQALEAAAGRPPASRTFPGANDALWRLLFGGLYPRRYDKGALNQNAARERSGR